MEGMENQVTDLAFHVRRINNHHQKVTPDQIVIIDIDDASLKTLGRSQLWPRSYDARVINYISSGNPAAIGIDFLYTEPDTLSQEYERILESKGFQNADQITNAMSTDAELNDAVQNAGNVYLSFFDDDKFSTDQDSVNATYNNLRIFSFEANHQFLFHKINHAVLPYSPLADYARGLGSIAVPTMQDGTVRHYRLLQELTTNNGRKNYVANFPLYMMLDHLGVKDEEVSINEDGLQLGKKASIPLRKDGSFRINWLGNEEKFRYISYYKVLDELMPAEFFENKFVFLGTSASGLQDLKTVPSQNDKIPGVEVHANAFLNMMNNAFIREIDDREARPWFALAGVLLVFIFLLTKPLIGFGVALLLYLAERFLFELRIIPEYNIIFPITTLMLLTLLTYLLASLYTYFIRERKSRKLKNAFGTYVSPEIVEQIAREPGKFQLGGEKKELTVLFSDIRNFTSYSERLDPQQIVAMLNNYLSSMSEIIFKHKGTIDKFIGDAIMAIFGAPVALTDHADRACLVALDMIDELKQFNLLEIEKENPPLRIGIGINTGDMTVGNIGSMKRFDYTVIGDAVNVGARIEGLTKFFSVEIIVSEPTKNACNSDQLYFRELGEAIVKGKDQPVVLFELQRKKEDAAFVKLSKIWKDAFAFLHEKKLKEASDCFTQYLTISPVDVPSQYYLKQCQTFIEDPQNFSLILKMETK